MSKRIALVIGVAFLAGCSGSKGREVDEAPSRATRSSGSGDVTLGGRPTTSTTTRPTDVPATPGATGLPAGWEIAPTGTYSAKQAAGHVTITAKGENPTAGHEVKLMQGMLKIWPPQYVLIRKRPAGMAAQVVTPFEVTASFKASEPVKQVVVRDGAGRHEVTVGQ
jgi:hypothetical protein